MPVKRRHHHGDNTDTIKTCYRLGAEIWQSKLIYIAQLLGSNNEITAGPTTGTVFVKNEVITGIILVYEKESRGHTHITMKRWFYCIAFRERN